MSVHHSDETYANLVARLPQATGRDVKEWCQVVEDGPSFSAPDETVHWLQDEHGLAAQLCQGDHPRVRQAARRPPGELRAS